MTAHTYEGSDERGSYFVKMENRNGDEVLTIIEPSPDDPTQNRLEINFYDRKDPIMNPRDSADIKRLQKH